MSKILSSIFSGILLIVVLFAVVFFGFDKTIPTNWANAQIEAVKTSKVSETVEMNKTPLSITAWSATYAQNEGKLVETFNYKAHIEFKNTSTKDSEAYEIKVDNYDAQGKFSSSNVTRYYIEEGQHYSQEGETKTAIANFNEFYTRYADTLSVLYNNEGNLNAELKDLIENNLEKVTQKGLTVTLHLVKDNVRTNITYNFAKKRIVRYEIITETYTNNVLASRSYNLLEI